MKLKTIIPFLFFFAAICGATVVGWATTSIEEIIIIVTGGTPPILKSAPDQLIRAFLVDGKVQILSQNDLGAITLVISRSNTQETVYQITDILEDGEIWSVNVEDETAGDYTITFTRSDGQTLTGDFEL